MENKEMINYVEVFEQVDTVELNNMVEKGATTEELIDAINLKDIFKKTIFKNFPSVSDQEIEDEIEKYDIKGMIDNFLNIEDLDDVINISVANFSKLNKSATDEVVGQAFESLSPEEMVGLQGAGDIDGETISVGVLTGISAIASFAVSLIKG